MENKKKILVYNLNNALTKPPKVQKFSFDFFSDSFINTEFLFAKTDKQINKFKISDDEVEVVETYEEKSGANSSSALQQFNSIAFNSEFTYAVKSSGEVFSSSSDLKSFVKLGSTISKKYIIRVAVAESNAFFLTHAGMVFAVGENNCGQLGLGQKAQKITEPALIEGLIDYRVNEITCGKNHVLCFGTQRKANSNSKTTFVYGWGDNKYSQLKTSISEKAIFLPQKLMSENPSGPYVCSISCGLNHSCVVFDDGNANIFGDNQFNQCSPTAPDSMISIFRKANLKYIKEHPGEGIKTIIGTANSTMVVTYKNALIYFGKICGKNNYKVLTLNVPFNEVKINFTDTKINIFYYSGKEKKILVDNEEEPKSKMSSAYSTKNIQGGSAYAASIAKKRAEIKKSGSITQLSYNTATMPSSSTHNKRASATLPNENLNDHSNNLSNLDIESPPRKRASNLSTKTIPTGYNTKKELNRSMITPTVKTEASVTIKEIKREKIIEQKKTIPLPKSSTQVKPESHTAREKENEDIPAKEEVKIKKEEATKKEEPVQSKEPQIQTLEKKIVSQQSPAQSIPSQAKKEEEEKTIQNTKQSRNNQKNVNKPLQTENSFQVSVDSEKAFTPTKQTETTRTEATVKADQFSVNNKALEQSMEELRSYINFVSPVETDKNLSQSLSFRPKNLPPKTPEEEQYHRRLVEENKKMYLSNLKAKQEKEQKIKRRLEEKKRRQQVLSNVWSSKIIPNWIKLRNDVSIKKYFYLGLPDNLRGTIWSMCLGNAFSITKEYYEMEVKKAIDIYIKVQEENKKSRQKQSEEYQQQKAEQSKYNILPVNKEDSIHVIDLDIERTFPYLGIFKQHSPLNEDLREILRAFVASRPDIGYVQGLSFIGGMLLLVMDKLKAYICMMNLVLNPIILPFFRFDENAIKTRLSLFKQVFLYNLPELCNHFELLGILPEYYFVEWNMTMFTKSVNIDIAMRIWDVYMIEGIIAIYSAGIVFLSHFEEKFLEMEFEEILKQIKTINVINFDDDMVIEAMKNVQFPQWVQIEIEKMSDESIPIY